MESSPPLIGIDLLEPKRLGERLLGNPRLRGELFTAGEVDYSERQPNVFEHLAARYCAKEAVVKALGLDGFDPLDVEVIDGGEATQLQLHGAILSRAQALGLEVSVSLCHVAGMAGAVALALPVRARRLSGAT